MDALLASSTFSEARRLGKLMARLFIILERFRKNKELFSSTFANVEQLASTDGIDPLPEVAMERVRQEREQLLANGESDIMSHKVFCTYFRRWHQECTIWLIKAITCKYDQVYQKNSILFLFQLSQQEVFPLVSSHARWLQKNVTDVEKERGSAMDLLCNRVVGIIARNDREGKQVSETTFGGYGLNRNKKKSQVSSTVSDKNALLQEKLIKEENKVKLEKDKKRKALEDDRPKSSHRKKHREEKKRKLELHDGDEDSSVHSSKSSTLTKRQKNRSHSASVSTPTRKMKSQRREKGQRRVAARRFPQFLEIETPRGLVPSETGGGVTVVPASRRNPDEEKKIRSDLEK